ncbi:S-methyl-5'-thioadenosine phosphorylase [Neolecta irregularis DAH-3]|uniref:S-methyl-5'-thioadenosine phosphorylase n=1 Tax=Neolecta irregularis (strain DAH-3) TaxID=1198029 RepID=A0A1U7LRH5_NEOID|nr:S-methyl-5'-thioadenosine phosphorylase [Neolecta irregularis DAH-3]|eukprot:OLL25183.1 S-methyl-5'-thioadenosine phosphorylase [Neolecta irregularis DAH-3]
MSKRTLDAFLLPSKRCKRSSSPLLEQSSESPSTHDSYPFPISALPFNLDAHILPASKRINNLKDLDILSFTPFIQRSASHTLFEFLRNELPWYRVEYPAHNRIVKTPRFTTVFGIDDTGIFAGDGSIVENPRFYSTQILKVYKCTPRPIPSCLLRLKRYVEKATGEKFNFCLLNYYKDGDDSISYHSDDEKFLGKNPCIASLTLGESREFLMKHKGDSSVKWKTNLVSGDMIVMRGTTQARWLHSIPKRKFAGGRINITFRKAIVRGGTENYNQYNIGSGNCKVFKIMRKLIYSLSMEWKADEDAMLNVLTPEEKPLPSHIIDTVPIAVIGGSGFYSFDALTPVAKLEISTPWGSPSSPITIAKTASGTPIAFLARHGPGHTFSPSTVPYRENIAALKSLGVKIILAFSAVGSLQEEISPGDFVVPTQVIDRTKGIRPSSFFEDGLISHVSFADPFCSDVEEVIDSVRVDGLKIHSKKTLGREVTLICMEGPAFSTRAESNLYRSWGGDAINMSCLPESKLALEAEISYGMICMATDYDCWRDSEDIVTVDEVTAVMTGNVMNAMKILALLLAKCERGLTKGLGEKRKGQMKFSIATKSDFISKAAKEKIAFILPGYWS